MNLRRISVLFILLVLTVLPVTACSRGDGDAVNPTAPTDASIRHSSQWSGHVPLAYYEVVIDLRNETLNAIPMRGAEFHLNVLPFMEPPPMVYLKLDWSSLVIDPINNTVDVDVMFVHPFGSLNEFMGFDVKGIVITDGSLGGFNDTGVVIPKATEPRLVNADGYTRWWNPREFSGGGMFGYNDGLLGSPDGWAHYDSTVNGYKYFADGLYKYTPVFNINTLLRGRFSAGAVNTRHYELDFGDDHADFLIFNYAVDASWAPPTKVPPDGMEDFPPEANQTEAFVIVVTEEENTLYYSPQTEQSGGHVDLRIDIKDWQGLETVASVRVEAPELFDGFVTCEPDPANNPEDIFGTYYATIEGEPPNNNGVQVLVTVEDIAGGFDQDGMNSFGGPTGTLLAAYQVHTAEVSTNTPPTVGPVSGETEPTCGLCYTYMVSASDYEDDMENLVFEWIVSAPGSPPEDYYDIESCPDDGNEYTAEIAFLKNGTFTIDVKVTDTDGGYSYSSDPMEANAQYGAAPDPVGNVILIVNRDSPIEVIDTILLDWDTVSGAGGYAVYWTDEPYNETPSFTLLDTTYGTEYTIDPVNPNNAYLFTVRARTIITNPATESGDSEYAFVEFETAEDADPYPWTCGYRVYGVNDRFAIVTGAGAQPGQKGWRMDIGNTRIESYSWSVIASPPIPVFDDVEVYRLEFLRHHPAAFDFHALSFGTTDDIYNSANATFPNFDTTMNWLEGANYNVPVSPAIQQKFGELPSNSGAYDDYAAYFTYSAFEIPRAGELIASESDARAAIGYAGYYKYRTARVELDDIAVIVY